MKIKLSSVMVEDQDKALKFYTEVLGFAKVADISMGPYRWLTVTSPEGVEGVELVLEPMAFPPAQDYQKALFDAGIPATAFMTDDVSAEYQRLKGLGVAFRGEPKNMGPITAVVFEDTCGNLINLVQPNDSSQEAPNTADREIISTRVLDAPRERVFKACTDPAHLSRWWGPQGFTNTFHEFDLKPGGHWRFVMHGPDGADYSNHSVFVEIAPPDRLVLDHISGPKFRLAITLDEAGGKTCITFRQAFETVAEYEKIKGLAVPANEQNFDRLEAELAGMA